MAITISNLAAIDELQAIVNLTTVGVPAAVLKVYGGTKPPNADDAASATLLANVVLPAFGAVTDDAANNRATVSLASAAGTVLGLADGTATHFRIVDGNGLSVVQGTAGTAGADAIFNSVSIVNGADVTLQSLTLNVNE